MHIKKSCRAIALALAVVLSAVSPVSITASAKTNAYADLNALGASADTSLDLRDAKVKPYYYNKSVFTGFGYGYSFSSLAGQFDLTAESAAAFAEVYETLVGAGYSEAAAAGIVGNLIWECDGNFASVSSDGQAAIGMVQWQGSRKTAFMNYINSKGYQVDNPKGQTEYLLIELNGSEGNGLDRATLLATGGLTTSFKALTDEVLAAEVFCIAVERPSHGAERGQYTAHQQTTFPNYYAGSAVPIYWAGLDERIARAKMIKTVAAVSKTLRSAFGSISGGALGGKLGKEALQAIFGCSSANEAISQYTQSGIEAQLVTVPFTDNNGITRTVRVNKAIADMASEGLTELFQSGLQYVDVGGYSFRNNVNAKNAASYHALGLAIDVNATQNPNAHGTSAAVNRQAQVISQLQGVYNPKGDARCITSAEALCMMRHGFCWGRDFTNSPDMMHFSLENGIANRNIFITEAFEGAGQ